MGEGRKFPGLKFLDFFIQPEFAPPVRLTFPSTFRVFPPVASENREEKIFELFFHGTMEAVDGYPEMKSMVSGANRKQEHSS